MRSRSNGVIRRQGVMAQARDFPSTLLLGIRRDVERRRPTVVGPVVGSRFFLHLPSRSTKPSSTTAKRSLLSALRRRRRRYINLTTGVVNIHGHVVYMGSNGEALLVCGPRVLRRIGTCRADRKYLSLSNRHPYAHCHHVGIRCLSRGFIRHVGGFSNCATRVVRRRVSRYYKVIV